MQFLYNGASDFEEPGLFVTLTQSPQELISDFRGYGWDIEKLIEKEKTGIYNITNPGSVRNEDILEMYKKLVDRNHEYNMIPSDKLVTKGGRSNCVLNSDKLAEEGIILGDATEMIEACLKEYKQRL